MTRMTETAMPKRGGGGGHKGVGGSRETQGVQRPGAIVPCDLVPCQQILNRATRGVKLNRTVVVNGELAN
jgi:hypothetical protein